MVSNCSGIGLSPPSGHLAQLSISAVGDLPTVLSTCCSAPIASYLNNDLCMVYCNVSSPLTTDKVKDCIKQKASTKGYATISSENETETATTTTPVLRGPPTPTESEERTIRLSPTGNGTVTGSPNPEKTGRNDAEILNYDVKSGVKTALEAVHQPGLAAGIGCTGKFPNIDIFVGDLGPLETPLRKDDARSIIRALLKLRLVIKVRLSSTHQ
ncbi:hypothetical protein BCR34DRAFT_616203 [Clohesyomyces aquaticus]|uniref:Uncharacterized protein n=1 Tax=Clohesyomyces aquaticus TaxID=1231657 RepID=A0A1Y1ZFN3_9PLEO|nr:hypothetical protein BCR34DRAFT_616203 [Clohesyomyces aquaticus]